MHKIVALLLVCSMALALAACGGSSAPAASSNSAPAANNSAPAASSNDSAPAPAANNDSAPADSGAAPAEEGPVSPVAGKKIASIMLLTPATISNMWSDEFTKTAEALGMSADTFFCSDNADTWQNTIAQCAAGGYDGLMVSHGGQEYAWSFLSGILQQYPDLKIVTFDTPFKDANGDVQKIDGVTQFFQQDAGFADALVQELLKLNQDKVDAGEPVRILQVQQGQGYNSPFDRRQVGYQPYLDNGTIVNVERIAPIDDQNATNSMRDVTAATLQKYNDIADIDGIWCCYDAYAQGVYQALKEAGSQIPMVSVDISNEDINCMAEGTNWKACATTNWTSNGEFACRVLACELAGDYDAIANASCYYGDIGAWMEIPSTIITQEMVMSKDGVNIENLDEVAPASYKDRTWMPTTDWMDALLGPLT
ncbi:MAG: substrate-binding domain-containing protein [Oscillospiraceae bacterium]|nr:substrate-binding domain-containing protein [Oscillospiraceae bacterium]